MSNETAITTTTANQLAHRGGALEFSPEQRKIIRDSFASGANDMEFAVLMEIAKARKLNPLLRQIHFVKRWDSEKRTEVWAPQVGIDGMRAIAERTGLYDGQDEPEFEHGKDGRPVLCRVRVYRKDWSRPSVGLAYFAEFAQTKRDGGLTRMWSEKPHVMLAKCAEAIAIRKAFPEDTSDLYVEEEIQTRETMAERAARNAEAIEAQVVEPAPFPADLAAQIESSATLDTLKSLVPALQAAPAEHKQALRAAYNARQQALRSPPPEVVEAEVVEPAPDTE